MAKGIGRNRVRATVIVPWWNHPELIGDFAEAVGSERADEVLIMDNASEPEVAHSLDELLGRRCGMTVVHRNTNSQLQALTEGVRLARNETIVFLNNDVVRRAVGWLSMLVESIEPGVFCGAQLREVEGVKYLDGWCWGFRREDFERIGGYDLTFEEPAYWADVEISARAQAHGITLKQIDLPLHHLESVSSRPLQRSERFWQVFERNRQRLMERLNGGLGVDVVEQA